jgi:hypothetical protein
MREHTSRLGVTNNHAVVAKIRGEIVREKA